MFSTAPPSAQTNKRHIMAETNTTESPSIDHWVESMYQQLEQRLNDMQGECQSEMNKQKHAFTASMVKLPRNVKSMTIGEFNAMYNVNLLKTVQDTVPHTGLQGIKKGPQKQTVAQTPAVPSFYGLQKKPLMTPSRTVRKGEILYSQNGSPVEADNAAASAAVGVLVASVTKPNRTGGGGPTRLLSTTTAASLEINVGNGQSISLQDPSGVTQLKPEQKDSTILQLQLLKEQVDSALQKLQT